MASNMNLCPLDTFGLMVPTISIPYIAKGHVATILKTRAGGAFVLSL